MADRNSIVNIWRPPTFIDGLLTKNGFLPTGVSTSLNFLTAILDTDMLESACCLLLKSVCVVHRLCPKEALQKSEVEVKHMFSEPFCVVGKGSETAGTFQQKANSHTDRPV